MVRVFKSGATRSSKKGKPEFYGYRHPLTELSFGEYMLRHQVQEDGKERASTNWWGGWSKEVSLQSLLRHVEQLTALEAGYRVFLLRVDGSEKILYLTDKEADKVKTNKNLVEVDEEEVCNAIRFNSMAYLLEHLKKN